MTIAQSATEALIRLNHPASIAEIYRYIIENKLYTFNTDVPEHVLRTEIRRKTSGVERVDSSDEVLFELVGDELYQLVKSTSKKRASIGNKRIHRAKDKEHLIEQLTDPKNGVFKEIWRALLFCATLGYAKQIRVPLGAVDAGKGIDQATFSNHHAWPGISYLFAMVETDSTRGLAASEDDEDLRIQVFEEYANGGLEILRDEAGGKDLNLESVLLLVEQLRENMKPLPEASLDIGI
jgi:dnd system-associated protein 4